MKELRPWNLKPGDHFNIWDLTATPSRLLTFEVTEHPIAERNHFNGERVWIVARKLVSTSDGRGLVFAGEVSRLYSDERVQVTNR